MPYEDNLITAEKLALVGPDEILLAGPDDKYSLIKRVPVNNLRQLYSLAEDPDEPGLQLIKTVLNATGENINALEYHKDPRCYFREDTDMYLGTLKTDGEDIEYVDVSSGIIAALVSGGDIRFNKDVCLDVLPGKEEEFNATMKEIDFYNMCDFKDVKLPDNHSLDDSDFSKLTLSDINSIANISMMGNAPPLFMLVYKGEDDTKRHLILPSDLSVDILEKIDEFAVAKGLLKEYDRKMLQIKRGVCQKHRYSILNELLQRNNCEVTPYLESQAEETDTGRILIATKAYLNIAGNEPKTIEVPSIVGIILGYLTGPELSVKEEVVESKNTTIPTLQPFGTGEPGQSADDDLSYFR